MNFYRPTWVEISRSALAHNLDSLQKLIGSSVKLLAVLKADAYGHGAASLISTVLEKHVFACGVSSLEEGIALREAGCSLPILILGGIFPLENFSVALEHNLVPTVASLESAQFLKKMAIEKNKSQVPFHLKVDTGMGRIGVSVEGAKPILQWLQDNPQLQLQGVYTHLSSADVDEEFTRQQLAHFDRVKKMVIDAGFNNVLFHAANSAGILFGADALHDMVRPGLLIYGISPKKQTSLSLKPVLSWRSQGVFIKHVPAGTPISYAQTYVTPHASDIMTVPVGYADGIPRSASNKGFVLVKGQRRPIVGRVTMDHIMVDVTGLNTSVGEPVVLIGKQDDHTLSVEDWASWAGTISYEIFCGISKRVPRVIVQ